MSLFMLLLSAAAGTAQAPEGPACLPFALTPRCPLEANPASFSVIREARDDRADSEILVVVNAALQSPLAAELTRFQQDLEAEGYDVTMTAMSGGTAASLRSMLQGHAGLGGAIFVGWLPAAWYEMDEWGGPHEEFPLDLYFMDLNGTWTDSDGDGMFDAHAGNRQAEIWVGRIDAHAIEFGNEVDLLRDFFDKNHLYRTGGLAVPARALAYDDDDWSGYGASGLDLIYSSVTVVNDPAQTTAAYYRDRMAYGYEFIHLMAHSSPWGHTFKSPSGYSGTVMSPEIAEINPHTAFVQLFACSNCRWTEPNCLGNWYLFGTDYVQLAIGSTKTGSMLEFESFYGPIGSGSAPGVAFRAWMNSVGLGDPAWHYGCVLLGDPTIEPQGGGAMAGVGSHQGGSDAYVKVSTSTTSDCFPSVAVSGENVWIAWMTGSTSRLDIAARNFDGDSWSGVMLVDSDEYWDVSPSLAIDGAGQPWLAWSSFDENTYGYDIMLAHGAGFGTVQTVTTGSGYDVDPCLAWASGKLWLVWQTWRRGEGDIMVRSTDGSYPPSFLSAQGSEDFSPTAAAGPDGKVHAAWVRSGFQGDQILWSYGSASGFSSPVAISSGGFCRAPVLGVAAGQLFAAWQQDDSGSSIRVRRWGGGSWEAEQTIFSSPSLTAVTPSIGESPTGAPVLAWQQGKGAGAQIWASTLTGSGWSAPAQLVNPAGPAWSPALADGVIAWAGTAGTADWDIYVSLEGGLGAEGPSGAGNCLFAPVSNPARGDVRLRSVGAWTGPAEMGMDVYDLAGRLVVSTSGIVSAEGVLTVPTGGAPSGIYFVRLRSGDFNQDLLVTILR